MSAAKKEFAEIRAASTDSLLFIKEDLIIPHHYSFYELIETAKVKSELLFDWKIHGNTSTDNESVTENIESHCVKIVERRWYDSSKHIYPMNRWETFDPTKANNKTKFT